MATLDSGRCDRKPFQLFLQLLLQNIRVHLILLKAKMAMLLVQKYIHVFSTKIYTAGIFSGALRVILVPAGV